MPSVSGIGILVLPECLTGGGGECGILVRLSVPVYSVISAKYIGKCRSSLKGKNFFIIIADTREMEYTPVPKAKRKADLWKHFNLRVTGSRVRLLVWEVRCNLSLNTKWFCWVGEGQGGRGAGGE